MATALRPIGHEDRLSLVEHLDELRRRLMICAVALVIAFAFAFWQNTALLQILNKPLQQSVTASNGNGGRLSQTARYDKLLRDSVCTIGTALGAVKAANPASATMLTRARGTLATTCRQLPSAIPKRQPVTLGVGEPFSQTTLVALYFAILIALPLILYQMYAFILPAFSKRERRVAVPLMTMIPLLFAAGVAFGYFAVLPAAISFLQNFNQSSFDVLVRAADYYKFELVTLLAMGLIFQLPAGMLALAKVGIVNVEMLRRNRRYAVVIIAIVAAALPGTDPVTTLLEMVPLLILYEMSILLVAWRGQPLPDDSDPDENELLTVPEDDPPRPDDAV